MFNIITIDAVFLLGLFIVNETVVFLYISVYIKYICTLLKTLLLPHCKTNLLVR